jgi:HAE1 family hydrophobic/amphiphilic exporter-1
MIFKLVLQHPWRIIVIVAILGFLGIFSALQLPLSLFPQTSKPTIVLGLNYGGLSNEEFIRKYGVTIESDLKNIQNSGLDIESVQGNYGESSGEYRVEFNWGTRSDLALKEVEAVAASAKGYLPKLIADSVYVWTWSGNSGFLALAFTSKQLSLNQLHKELSTLMAQDLRSISEAKEALLWNPQSLELSIELKPERLLFWGLKPQTVYDLLYAQLPSYSGGELQHGPQKSSLKIHSPLRTLEELKKFRLRLEDGTPTGVTLTLEEIAAIELRALKDQNQKFKTDGLDSLILFASPKNGANLKKMADDVMKIVHNHEARFPPGTDYKILVDPGQIIQSSISHLFIEVLIAAGLASFVLFLFLGHLRQVLTAAIEIPLSLIIAFIAMKMADMNLNLVSLGGLALAAGMNVDASVIVLEIILKRTEKWKKENPGKSLSIVQKKMIIAESLSEITPPLFLSIATTLVVFIPLIFTSNLTNALLGDLAKAIVYSHALSGLVAVLFVPCVRLLLPENQRENQQRAPLHTVIDWLQHSLLKLIDHIQKRRIHFWVLILTPFLLLASAVFFIPPRLKKELIGKPSTDWVFVYLNAPLAQNSRQTENLLQELEVEAKKILGSKIQYTFMQIFGEKNGNIMFRLQSSEMMDEALKRFKEKFKNTATLYYHIDSWNPAELPIPDLFDMEFELRSEKRQKLTNPSTQLHAFLQENSPYERYQIQPQLQHTTQLEMTPFPLAWDKLPWTPADLVSFLSFSAQSRAVGSLNISGEVIPLNLSVSPYHFHQTETFSSLPLKINQKIIPLTALGEFTLKPHLPDIKRKEGSETRLFKLELPEEKANDWEQQYHLTKAKIEKWFQSLPTGHGLSLKFELPKKELSESLNQLQKSLLLSLLLIIFLIWMQFQSLTQTGIVLMAIPFGLIGGLLSLWIFHSTLSLNSILGFILLNGIAVNNSIMLIEVFQQLREQGYSYQHAVREATISRLRPILITSLTTILGMLPLSLGLGEGGKVLQPLGIVVCSGLFISTILTLVFVPSLLLALPSAKKSTITEASENVDINNLPPLWIPNHPNQADISRERPLQ